MYLSCSENKVCISFAVTLKLICVFVFAYARSRFSHDEAHMMEVFFKHVLQYMLYNQCYQ